MNFTSIKNKPFHVFLLPVFYILHAVNAYYGLFPARFPLYYLACYLALAAVLYFFSWLFFRSAGRSGFWCLLILIILFFFGKGHDLLRSVSFLQPIAGYKILLPLLLVLTILLTIYVKRTKHEFRKANTYFNLLFLVFVLVEAGQFSARFIAEKKQSAKSGKQDTPVLNRLPAIPDSMKPDVFFIVFDEYTSSASLKKYFSFDNTRLDSSLSAAGFYQATAAKSNYNSTPFSLGSTFNLDYFNLPLENKVPTPAILLKGSLLFAKSAVPVLLEQEGYEIKNLGVLDIEQHPASQRNYFQEEYKSVFYEETIWNRIVKEIFWNWQLKFPDRVEKKYREVQTAGFDRYTASFKHFLQELKIQTEKPRLVYGHIFMPHRPYYVNRKGEFMNTVLNYEQYSRDSLYLEQLSFCNTWIDSIVNTSGAKFKRPRVIIIEGDHGYRDADDNLLIRDRQFMNLSAYYFSDRNYTMLYDSISPVNSFRVIFNKYFRTGLPLLKDSTVFLH